MNSLLAESLGRYFEVARDEESGWRLANDLSVRLEGLGHALAMTLTQPQPPPPPPPPHAHLPMSPSPPPLVIIALVVPVTSRGSDPLQLHSSLALFTALLPSLYRTRSPGFRYRLYLAANQHDPVYGSSSSSSSNSNSSSSSSRVLAELFEASKQTHELLAQADTSPPSPSPSTHGQVKEEQNQKNFPDIEYKYVLVSVGV